MAKTPAPFVDLVVWEGQAQAVAEHLVERQAVGFAGAFVPREYTPARRESLALEVLVAPATRTIRGIPTEVTLTRDDGMPHDCALSFDNLATVPKALLTTRITIIPDSRLPELCNALRAASGC